MHFGSVKETIERFLAFLAQSLPERLKSFPFGFRNMAKWENCPANFPLDYFELLN
jgi:hypothetical protein